MKNDRVDMKIKTYLDSLKIFENHLQNNVISTEQVRKWLESIREANN